MSILLPLKLGHELGFLFCEPNISLNIKTSFSSVNSIGLKEKLSVDVKWKVFGFFSFISYLHQHSPLPPGTSESCYSPAVGGVSGDNKKEHHRVLDMTNITGARLYKLSKKLHAISHLTEIDLIKNYLMKRAGKRVLNHN